MFCEKCGTANDDAAAFCKGCGNSLSSEKKCPKCDTTVTPEAEFCPTCGNALKQQQSSELRDSASQLATQVKKTAVAGFNTAKEKSMPYIGKAVSAVSKKPKFYGIIAASVLAFIILVSVIANVVGGADYRKAARMMNRGDYEDAYEIYSDMLQDNPRNARVYLEMGKAFEKDDNENRALQSYSIGYILTRKGSLYSAMEKLSKKYGAVDSSDLKELKKNAKDILEDDYGITGRSSRSDVFDFVCGMLYWIDD